MIATEDNVYWTIKPSIIPVSSESENYEDNCPRKPWKGKLRISGNNIHYLLYSFNEETGIIDNDPNAIAQVGTVTKPEKLFATYDEAKEAYIDAMLLYIQNQSEEVISLVEKLRAFIAKTPTS